MMIVCAGSLLRYVGYRRRLHYPGAGTVREALTALTEQHPVLTPLLLTPEGELRPSHRLILGDSLLGPAELDTPVGPEDRLEILTSISGG
ncbi:MoaD/ThiS family protein [Streptomyces polygonati]|uniref:MoaD/ThiS family protein n=1 Tax=Streptomyces polygonati TaxID=1617087 RepID=A0ABV8HI08_9ACTN